MERPPRRTDDFIKQYFLLNPVIYSLKSNKPALCGAKTINIYLIQQQRNENTKVCKYKRAKSIEHLPRSYPSFYSSIWPSQYKMAGSCYKAFKRWAAWRKYIFCYFRISNYIVDAAGRSKNKNCFTKKFLYTQNIANFPRLLFPVTFIFHLPNSWIHTYPQPGMAYLPHLYKVF